VAWLGTKTSIPSIEADEPHLFPVRKCSEETRSALSARKSARVKPKTGRSATDGQVEVREAVAWAGISTRAAWRPIGRKCVSR
jgi:hypothetical protein